MRARGWRSGRWRDGSRAALAQLPEGCRAAFLLHDVEGLEHREVAEVLGIAEGTSKSQVHKARLRLRALLARTRRSRRRALHRDHTSRRFRSSSTARSARCAGPSWRSTSTSARAAARLLADSCEIRDRAGHRSSRSPAGARLAAGGRTAAHRRAGPSAAGRPRRRQQSAMLALARRWSSAVGGSLFLCCAARPRPRRPRERAAPGGPAGGQRRARPPPSREHNEEELARRAALPEVRLPSWRMRQERRRDRPADRRDAAEESAGHRRGDCGEPGGARGGAQSAPARDSLFDALAQGSLLQDTIALMNEMRQGQRRGRRANRRGQQIMRLTTRVSSWQPLLPRQRCRPRLSRVAAAAAAQRPRRTRTGARARARRQSQRQARTASRQGPESRPSAPPARSASAPPASSPREHLRRHPVTRGSGATPPSRSSRPRAAATTPTRATAAARAGGRGRTGRARRGQDPLSEGRGAAPPQPPQLQRPVAYTVTAPPGPASAPTRSPAASGSATSRVRSRPNRSAAMFAHPAGGSRSAKTISGDVEVADTDLDGALESVERQRQRAAAPGQGPASRRSARSAATSMVEDVDCAAVEAQSVSGNVQFAGRWSQERPLRAELALGRRPPDARRRHRFRARGELFQRLASGPTSPSRRRRPGARPVPALAPRRLRQRQRRPRPHHLLRQHRHHEALVAHNGTVGNQTARGVLGRATRRRSQHAANLGSTAGTLLAQLLAGRPPIRAYNAEMVDGGQLAADPRCREETRL